MELNIRLKTEKNTKENSAKSFFIGCLIIITVVCFSIYCFTNNGYNFDIYIEGENERAVIQGTYNNSTQK